MFGTLILNLTSLRGFSSMVSQVDKNLFFPSSKTRVCFFFGTRPEVIKLAPVIHAFLKSNHFQVVTIFTGQHPDLINPFLESFDIFVDVSFNNIFNENQSITKLIGKIMIESERFAHHESDIWMVQGDTSTAFAIATVAFHRGLRIAHVEAGLRTFNMYSPFPEEFNRKTISSIATFHFAPTQKNKNHLLKEGIPGDRIFVTGNTVLDAVKYLNSQNKTRQPQFLKKVNLNDKILILITLHRRENTGIISKVLSTIQEIPCSKCLFIVPVHVNPNASKPTKMSCEKDPKRFICTKALAYEAIHWIIKRSQFILTDSGGLQEEATWYQVPVVVLRKYSDRMEAVEAGIAALVGQDWSLLRETMGSLLNKSNSLWKRMTKSHFPFGHGNASEQIVNILKSTEIRLAKKFSLTPPDLSLQENHLLNTFYPIKIGVVLQVFKRNTLQKQLEAAVKQTLLPKTIIVLQNGHYVDVAKTIQTFRLLHPRVELQHIAASKNLRFHGRFHIAYMMRESYVSVWDDDVLPRSEWLQYCVDFSKLHGNALVGSHGKRIIHINENKVILRESFGRSDFVGHTWTLPRTFLKYYLESEKLTLHTGEDIQLSFALQKVGKESWKPVESGDRSVGIIKGFGDEKTVASWRQNQAPSELLFCKILKAGFKPLNCSNCNDDLATDGCIRRVVAEAQNVEDLARGRDREDSDIVVWTALELK